MNENKNLEKIAGVRFNKAVGFVEDLIGRNHSILKNKAATLAEAEAKGITANMMFNQAEEAGVRKVNARIGAGVTAAGVGTAGFLGIHKYHQHRDNAIMAKIDQMYADQNQQQY